MPLHKLKIYDDHAWAVWKITEPEDELAALVFPIEQIPSSITNTFKRLEWITGRIVARRLMDEMNEQFNGIIKDSHGKPFLSGSTLQLSLSHSFPYVAAYLHRRISVGIDLEQPKQKLLKVAPRVLTPGEYTDAGSDLKKHCIYWCAKEALIKVHGKKDLIFSQNLTIDAFSIENQGQLVGNIIVHSMKTSVILYYEIQPDYIMVLNKT